MRRWINLCEGLWWDNTDTITLYHGTSSSFVPTIEENGLLPPKKGLSEYVSDILEDYVNPKKWTPELKNKVYETAVDPYIDGDHPLFFMTEPSDLVKQYANDYAKHGGEIARNVWAAVCWYYYPKMTLEDLKNDPPIRPRFPNAYPVLLTVEIPKSWCDFRDENLVGDENLESLKNDCQRRANGDQQTLEHLYKEALIDSEVLVNRQVPPEMIKSITRL